MTTGPASRARDGRPRGRGSTQHHRNTSAYQTQALEDLAARAYPHRGSSLVLYLLRSEPSGSGGKSRLSICVPLVGQVETAIFPIVHCNHCPTGGTVHCPAGGTR
jgi:hypothetical protein